LPHFGCCGAGSAGNLCEEIANTFFAVLKIYGIMKDNLGLTHAVAP